MKPQIQGCEGFVVSGNVVLHFPQYRGMTCYAMLVGRCWLVVDGVSEPIMLIAGDCFLLPQGRPFTLARDPLPKVEDDPMLDARRGIRSKTIEVANQSGYLTGAQFKLTGSRPDIFLHSLPPVIHIHRESDRAAMKWSLERIREEIHYQQPGSSLMMQQLVYLMLIQVLRLSLTDTANSRPCWLSGLGNPQIRLVIASIHEGPDHPWTLRSMAERAGMSRSTFVSRFRAIVGSTPMEYLTCWRMLSAAERLRNSSEDPSAIAHSLSYKSASAFGKAFRRLMGCSPRQYAKRKISN